MNATLKATGTSCGEIFHDEPQPRGTWLVAYFSVHQSAGPLLVLFRANSSFTERRDMSPTVVKRVVPIHTRVCGLGRR